MTNASYVLCLSCLVFVVSSVCLFRVGFVTFLFIISDNKHKLVQSMKPEESFTENEEKEFLQLEDKLRSNLSDNDK